MAQKIEVNLPILRGVIGSMDVAQKNLYDEISKAYESISGLNSMWTGEAAATFQGRAKQDLEYICEEINELNRITQKYNEAASTYQACEASVAAAVDSIKI